MNLLTATATNAAATITLAAISAATGGTGLGTSNRVDGVAFSYSGSPTGGRVTILDGAARTVTDGVTTNTSPTITSATAVFSSADVGSQVTGTGIGVNAKILSVTNATTAVLTVNSTASATGISITISPVVFDIDVTASGPQFLPVRRTGTPGKVMTVTLAAGGSGVVGKINPVNVTNV